MRYRCVSRAISDKATTNFCATCAATGWWALGESDRDGRWGRGHTASRRRVGTRAGRRRRPFWLATRTKSDPTFSRWAGRTEPVAVGPGVLAVVVAIPPSVAGLFGPQGNPERPLATGAQQVLRATGASRVAPRSTARNRCQPSGTRPNSGPVGEVREVREARRRGRCREVQGKRPKSRLGGCGQTASLPARPDPCRGDLPDRPWTIALASFRRPR